MRVRVKNTQPQTALSWRPRLWKNTPGYAPVPAPAPGRDTDYFFGSRQRVRYRWRVVGMLFVFRTKPVLFPIPSSCSVQTIRLPKGDALISGQGRAQDFPKFRFKSRGRCCAIFRAASILDLRLLYPKAPGSGKIHTRPDRLSTQIRSGVCLKRDKRNYREGMTCAIMNASRRNFPSSRRSYVKNH
jgi:hypothetical protein